MLLLFLCICFLKFHVGMESGSSILWHNLNPHIGLSSTFNVMEVVYICSRNLCVDTLYSDCCRWS